MIRTAKNIFLILVVSLLIISTGGYSIFHHVCHCAGEMSVSVFTEATCSHGEDSHACCQDEETQSCCANKPGHQSDNTCNGKDCCKNSVQFLKISDSFQPGTAKISLKPFPAISPFVQSVVPEINLQSSTFNLKSFDLPPPQTGKQIVVAQHQLKLDHPLV
ncbi:MAG: hypothetical protein RBS55_03895 [Bacteroidales bacterium]|jgi:hypothetical protein|nr:hypothetical protein [Bacteroidales bacterium]